MCSYGRNGRNRRMPYVCPVCLGRGQVPDLEAETSDCAKKVCPACLGACVLWEPSKLPPLVPLPWYPWYPAPIPWYPPAPTLYPDTTTNISWTNC
jgi:hypothetical protein